MQCTIVEYSFLDYYGYLDLELASIHPLKVIDVNQ